MCNIGLCRPICLCSKASIASQSSLALSPLTATSLPSLPPPPAAAAAAKEEKGEAGYCVAENTVDIHSYNTLNRNLEKHGAQNNQPDVGRRSVGNIYDSVDDVPCFYALESEDQASRKFHE